MKVKANTMALTAAATLLATLAGASASLEHREVWAKTLNFQGKREATRCAVTAFGDWKIDPEGRPWRAIQVFFTGFTAGNIQSVSHTTLFTDEACSNPLDVGPAPEDGALADPTQPSAMRNPFNPAILKGASWVIREIDTQKPVLETWDQPKVLALNTARFEAWPIAAHLHSYSRNA